MALVEICIAARTFRPGGTQEGDIIVMREPLPEIGAREGKVFLWMLMEDDNLPPKALLEQAAKAGKFRFNISLHSLKVQFPELDLARVRDPNDWYQPLLGTNPNNGRHTFRRIVTVKVNDKGA